MTALRTTLYLLTFVLLQFFWFLPRVAYAGDVTVDYSQLEPTRNNDTQGYMSPADIVTEDLASKQPIHLHPMMATIAAPTVKNLAATAKPEIHLHPLALKTIAVAPPLPLPPPQNPAPLAPPIVQSIQAPSAPVTSIDLALAAVPVAPKPAPTPKPEPEVAVVAPPETAPAAETPAPKTETASAPEPEPAAPTPQDKMAVAEPIVPPPSPEKPTNHETPGVIPVRDVVSKTDDLTPADVVGLDLGPPQKTSDN